MFSRNKFAFPCLLLFLLGGIVVSGQIKRSSLPETIVYERAPDDSAPWPTLDIYSVNSDGTNVKALTNDGHSHDASWSSDGRQILFIHDGTTQSLPAFRPGANVESNFPVGLYAMDRDGSSAHSVLSLGYLLRRAAWSSDSKTIAIALNLPPTSENRNGPGLFLVAANGQGEPRLLIRGAIAPSWSPDGRRLAISRQGAIEAINADGSGRISLTDPTVRAEYPAWSPDGKQIAFDADTGIFHRSEVFVMGADGSDPRQITTDPDWGCEYPSWSPNGQTIAFFCRAEVAPCSGIAPGLGTVLQHAPEALVNPGTTPPPTCVRRIFVIPVNNPPSKLTPLMDHDGAYPAFAPAS